ncbi:MAG: hypothetical protein PIR02_12030 [Microbacterium enclense]
MMVRSSASSSATTTMEAADVLAERRVLAVTIAGVGSLFAVATTTQSVMALGIFSVHLRAAAPSPVSELVARGLINLGTVAVLLGLAILVDLGRRRSIMRVVLAVMIAAVSGALRAVAQVSVGLYTHLDAPVVVAEIATTAGATLVTLAIGLVVALLWRRQRVEQRQRERHHALALAAHDELRAEEIRVRREVAQELHGTVQGTLVIAEAHVRHLIARAEGTSAATPADLAPVAESLRVIRDEHLRHLTSRLFPADLDRGVEAALDALVARMPTSIHIEDDYRAGALAVDARVGGAAVDNGDGLGLLLVQVVEEGITNALKHGDASCVRIGIDVTESGWVDVTIVDDGSGMELTSRRSGLARLSRRAVLLGGTLTANAGGIGERGSTLHARLPLG